MGGAACRLRSRPRSSAAFTPALVPAVSGRSWAQVAGLAEPPPPGKCLITGPRLRWPLRAYPGSSLHWPAPLSSRRPEPVDVGIPCPAAAGTAPPPPVGLGRIWDCGRIAARESADAAGRAQGRRCSRFGRGTRLPGARGSGAGPRFFRQGRRLRGLITWGRGVTSVPASQVPSVRPCGISACAPGPLRCVSPASASFPLAVLCSPGARELPTLGEGTLYFELLLGHARLALIRRDGALHLLGRLM